MVEIIFKIVYCVILGSVLGYIFAKITKIKEDIKKLDGDISAVRTYKQDELKNISSVQYDIQKNECNNCWAKDKIMAKEIFTTTRDCIKECKHFDKVLEYEFTPFYNSKYTICPYKKSISENGICFRKDKKECEKIKKEWHDESMKIFEEK